MCPPSCCVFDKGGFLVRQCYLNTKSLSLADKPHLSYLYSCHHHVAQRKICRRCPFSVPLDRMVSTQSCCMLRIPLLPFCHLVVFHCRASFYPNPISVFIGHSMLVLSLSCPFYRSESSGL
jgi:hypothetical protein